MKNYKKSILVWLLCMAVFLTGCGASGGDNQFTQMDEKYLAQKETDAPDVSRPPEDSGQQTSPESGNQGEKKQKESDSGSTKEEAEKKDEKASPGSKNEVKATPKKANKSSSKASKKNSASKKTSSSSKKPAAATATPRKDHEDSDQEEQGGECYISIDCKTILGNMDRLKSEKKAFVPKNGQILEKTKVHFQAGDTVYDILYRVCRENSIHLEASYTPAYKTYYIEGIHQLYEFDCGNLSGWNYLVNGVSVNYGCSKYRVKQGDVIAWRYTCDMGKDL